MKEESSDELLSGKGALLAGIPVTAVPVVEADVAVLEREDSVVELAAEVG